MCRYAFSGPYKEKWACFKCRKSFKQTERDEVAHPLPVTPQGEHLVLCPNCKNPMHDMGLDFRAPRQRDKEQWQVVEQLYKHGFTYASCGCGPGFRPTNLREVKSFLKGHTLAGKR